MSAGVLFGEGGSCRSLGRLGIRLAVTAAGVSAAVLLLSFSASAQTEPLQITAASADEWPAVEVTLTVFNEDGQPLTGLAPDDFSATLAGEALPASSLKTISDPGLGIAVVLAFDVSGSMGGEPLEQAKLAGRALIDQLGSDDQAAVVAFSTVVQLVQPFTADRSLLLAAVDGLVAGGNTALYGGVQQSAELASAAPVARSSIVLLSDGQDFGAVSTTTREASLDLVRESGALVFAVGLGPQIDESYLSELAQAGRGQFLPAPLPDDLTQAYLSAGNVLRQQYVLTLDASGLNPESETAVLVIEADLPAGLAVASIDIAVPAQPEPPVVTDAPPPGGEGVPQPGTEEASGGVPWVVVFGVAAVLIAGGGAVFAMRKRAPAPVDESTPERLRRRPAEVSFPEIRRAIDATESEAWLQGPDDARVAVGETPVTIGYTTDCTIVLPSSGGAREGRVRVWLRDGSYMLHNLSPRLGSVSVGGRPVTWVVLDDGDEIFIGGARLTFRCGNGSR
ncbi:MAG TPA: VWA domain-containing protein [Dehalococcoidia bacterium]